MKISTIVIGAIAGVMTMSSIAATQHRCPMPAEIKKVNGVFVGTDQEGGKFIEKFSETKAKQPGQFASATHYAPGDSQYGQIACIYKSGATLWLTQPAGKVSTKNSGGNWEKNQKDPMCFASSIDPTDCPFTVATK